ncbi:glutathione S-transferase family protein [Microvirga rosea]|uniref:glutathione S-transferase family protein n=1 Tax=Microvirga rosea TaxID=2715425 RepID=UPI001D0BCC63|nr:glutathione S-transferase [Microvirga rosea]MCB8819461.1 glutathione S-transferase [Microvirga rosea]
MLTIHGYKGSINVRKVLWTCAELGLPFERIDWGGGTRPVTDPEFRTLNPVGMIPVLEDGGQTFWESNSIVRYLAAREGRDDLLPTGPAERAQIEKWMDWQVSDFNNSWRTVFQATIRKNPQFQDEAQIAASWKQFCGMVEVLDRELARTKAYIAGPHFTCADIVIGLSAHRWKSIPLDRPSLPSVERYYDLLCEREGFRLFGRDGGP